MKKHPPLRPVLWLLALLAATPAFGGFKVYYIRHAEFGHNVVKQYENVPKDRRPAYVGDSDAVTPKGAEQIVAATAKLKKLRFDFIACSPILRSRHTILPYLRDTGRAAEIWPELAEFGETTTVLLNNGGALPKPGTDLFAGTPIQIPDAEAPFFTLRPGAGNHFKAAPRDNRLQRAADTKAALEAVIARLRAAFAGTDKTVLLSGHGNNGKCLLRLMVPNHPRLARYHPKNTALWMVEEQPGGAFALRLLDDKAVPEP
ncbi:MAG: histidine phosphatase family protein [Opitutaceae bacterium]|jgi:broad specificity phosphatase PhoE|nr:histidine phosphatase family protein [Opitutaceae bacterium]